MKQLLSLLSLLFVLQAHAFHGHEKFKVELVKPWGEFGFRALGKGSNIAEMRFDCGQTAEMGMVLTVVNSYGKTSNIVLPAAQLGADKHKCQQNLKKYFAGLYNKRGIASSKDKNQARTIELNKVQGMKTLSLR